MVTKPPPVPSSVRESDPALFRFLQDFVALFNANGQIDAGALDTTSHAALSNILGVASSADTTQDKHLSDNQFKAISDELATNSGNSTNAATDAAAAIAASGTNTADIATLNGTVTALSTTVTALQATVAAQAITIADHEARLVGGGL